MTKASRAGSLFAAVLTITLVGCVLQLGELRTVNQAVKAEGAETVVAEFDASSAYVDISGGASELMEASFTFNSDRLEPNVDYEVSGGEGRLMVVQPQLGFVSIGSEAVNEWEIELGRDVPIELIVDLSSGDATVDLETIDLISAELESSSGEIIAEFDGEQVSLESVKANVSSGQILLGFSGVYGALETIDAEASSGNLELDLTGEWNTDVDIDISASSGQVTVVVPDDVAVRATATTSSGNVSANGFTIDGDDYTLDGPIGASTLSIRVDVSSGNVTLRIG